MTTQTPTLPASWGSVRGGKWHATTEAHPSWARDAESLCGVTFRPVNVTHQERPDYVRLTAFCAKCAALTEAQQ